MKIRQGFVSNSSSSSFCVGKNYMTSEQIKQFQDWLVEMKDELYESYIHQGQYYFLGEISVHEFDKISDFLGSIGVDLQYVGTVTC